SPLNAPAKDPNYHNQDVIIILSDGINTQDRWYTSATSIDNRQRILCDDIKNAGVTIYAIQVNTSNDPTSSALQYCTGTRTGVADADNFSLLATPTQIIATLNQTGTGLPTLRISNWRARAPLAPRHRSRRWRFSRCRIGGPRSPTI